MSLTYVLTTSEAAETHYSSSKHLSEQDYYAVGQKMTDSF